MLPVFLKPSLARGEIQLIRCNDHCRVSQIYRKGCGTGEKIPADHGRRTFERAVYGDFTGITIPL